MEVTYCYFESLPNSAAFPFFMRQYADLLDSGFASQGTPWGKETHVVYAVAASEPERPIVGCVAFNYLRPTFTGWLVLSAVTAEYRRRGIYGRLHSQAEDRVRRMGGKQVCSTIHFKNAPALAASTQMGKVTEFFRVTKKLSPATVATPIPLPPFATQKVIQP